MKLRDALRLGAVGDTTPLDAFALSHDDLDVVRSVVADASSPGLDVEVVAGSMLAPVENDVSLADDGGLAVGAMADDGVVPMVADDAVGETAPEELVDAGDLGWADDAHVDLDAADDWTLTAETDAGAGDDDIDEDGDLG